MGLNVGRNDRDGWKDGSSVGDNVGLFIFLGLLLLLGNNNLFFCLSFFLAVFPKSLKVSVSASEWTLESGVYGRLGA